MKSKIYKRKIYCCSCNEKVDCVLVHGKDIYPHIKELYLHPYWQCTVCKNYVGCNYKSTDRTKPLGTIPTPELRAARQNLHKLIDPLWYGKKNQNVKRTKVYAKISELLGKEFHAGTINSMEEFQQVINIVNNNLLV